MQGFYQADDTAAQGPLTQNPAAADHGLHHLQLVLEIPGVFGQCSDVFAARLQHNLGRVTLGNY